MKLLDLVNSKGRDAHIEYFNPSIKKQNLLVTAEGKTIKNARIVKSLVTAQDLVNKYGSGTAVSEALITSDPEVDIDVAGKFVSDTTRVFVNDENKFVYNIIQKEYVYNQEGTLIEEREPKYNEVNVSEDSALKGSKLMPVSEIYNKFVFIRKYQLKHVNSLTYDFLFDIAKELHEKKSFMLLGAGAKGTTPLVFQNGGKPYRAFLEGRIDGDKYLLLLHLSNLELKPVKI